MTFKLIEANILTTGAQYICHQNNCVSKGDAAGIASVLFKQFPYADVYNRRTVDSIPGTIEVCGDGLIQRGIINMFSQYYPGRGNFEDDVYDSFKDRKKWFHQVLMLISDIPNLQSLAFPYNISCGLAGGDWNWYEDKLNKFSDYVSKKSNVQVLVYKI